MVLPEINPNYGNYRYGNYITLVIHLVVKVISNYPRHKSWVCTARDSVNIVKMTDNDRLAGGYKVFGGNYLTHNRVITSSR